MNQRCTGTGGLPVSIRACRRQWGVWMLALASAPLCAWAQQAASALSPASAEISTLPAVTVTATRAQTATKTDAPLIETPQAISVVTGAQMETQAIQNINQALRYTSGVVAETRGGSATREDFQYIRGFGPFGTNYLDGMKQPYASFGFFQNEPYFIDRIEILKGPSSVLYGQNSPGGLINLISKRPTTEPQHEIFVNGGSFGRVEAGADLSGPIDADGKLSYRLTAVGLTGATYVDHTRSERAAVAPALTWRPDANTTLTLYAQYLHDPRSGHFGYVPAQGTFLDNPNGRISRSFFDGEPGFNHDSKTQAAIGYELDHRYDSGWRLQQSLRYAHLDSDLAMVYGTGLASDLRTLNRAAFTDRDTIGALTFDNRLERAFDTGPLRHSVLFGVDYQHTDADARWLFGAAPGIDAFSPVYGQPVAAPAVPLLDQAQRLSQTGLYLQDQIRLDRWVLLAGLRHDWADNDTHNRSTDTSTTVRDTATTGRLGLLYQFDSGFAPYINYSTSFLPTTGTNWKGDPFKPTTGEQWEAGVKYQPGNAHGFVTASVFNLVQDNVQTLDPDPAHGPFAQAQSGRARARGIELEGHADLNRNLSVIANYTYLDNKVVRSNGPDLGKQPVSVPRNTASLWLDYRFHDSELPGVVGLNAGVRYIGASYADVANTERVPGFTVADAGVSYTKGSYRLALNVANVFDRRAVICSNGYNACNYIQPRTITASLRYLW
ncbi:TonB-dependent siderophore receptor [Pollutimonas bauzanensis]|uniref:Iron complex outermembrane recepter protein n=1 Tax=Pollutimonas bauzanensis TaxID=658167 RepID=A0A1M5Z8E3_9BURK|nr:TonB-dependent siderophore receptor [Pollutimonas bauzanensis]SHI20471.1 iron complex outermembrane recepter protein [Pollutimonas bauzanensis]